MLLRETCEGTRHSSAFCRVRPCRLASDDCASSVGGNGTLIDPVCVYSQLMVM